MHAPRPAARARPGRTSLAPARVPSGTVYPLYARICLSARCAWSSVSDPGPCCLLVLPRHHPASSVCSASAPASLFLTLRIRIRTPTVHLRNKPSPRHAIVISISNVHLHVILEARRSRPVESPPLTFAPPCPARIKFLNTLARSSRIAIKLRGTQLFANPCSMSSRLTSETRIGIPMVTRTHACQSFAELVSKFNIQTSERPPCQRAVTPAESDADAHTE